MKQTLTAEELSSLGHSYLACAQAVGNYRYTKTMSKDLNIHLSNLQWTLLNYSDDFYTSSASIVMSDVKKSLAVIKQVTKHINESYHRIRNVQKAIDIATAAITLAAALFSKNLIAIDDALSDLIKEAKS